MGVETHHCEQFFWLALCNSSTRFFQTLSFHPPSPVCRGKRLRWLIAFLCVPSSEQLNRACSLRPLWCRQHHLSTLNGLKTKMQHCPDQTWRNVFNTCLRRKVGWQISDKPNIRFVWDLPSYFFRSLTSLASTRWSNPHWLYTKRLRHPISAWRWILARLGRSIAGSLSTTLAIPDGVLEEDEPGKHQCRDDDFDSENLKDKDRFEGFADYIYWIEESKVPSALEPCSPQSNRCSLRNPRQARLGSRAFLRPRLRHLEKRTLCHGFRTHLVVNKHQGTVPQ